MSLPDDSLSPTQKNRARTSRRPRVSPQDSSFLQSKEADMSISNDPLAPREKNRASTNWRRESPLDLSFLSSKETEKKSQETHETSVSPVNTDEEVLTSRYNSYWGNPNYFNDDDIFMNTANKLNPCGEMFKGNMGSQIDHNPTQMKPTISMEGYGINTSGLSEHKSKIVFGSFGSIEMIPFPRVVNAPHWTFKKILDAPEMSRLLHNPGSHIGVSPRPDMEQETPNISIDGIDVATFFDDPTDDSQLPYDNLQGLETQGEGYGINTCGPFEHKSNISFGSFGRIEPMKNAKREKEKIVMIPTPRFVNTPQWTIKKILTSNDINAYTDSIFLQESSFDEHIRRNMPESYYQKVVNEMGGIVNVYDYDMDTMHKLRLLPPSRGRYGLTDGWRDDFVGRRSLRRQEEIGLLWDSCNSRLVFGVISRSDVRRVERRKYKSSN